MKEVKSCINSLMTFGEVELNILQSYLNLKMRKITCKIRKTSDSDYCRCVLQIFSPKFKIWFFCPENFLKYLMLLALMSKKLGKKVFRKLQVRKTPNKNLNNAENSLTNTFFQLFPRQSKKLTTQHQISKAQVSNRLII